MNNLDPEKMADLIRQIVEKEGEGALKTGFQIRMLNESDKRKCLQAYRTLFDSLKELNVNKQDFQVIIDKVADHFKQQNATLQEYGINETMTMDSRCCTTHFKITEELLKLFNTSANLNIEKLMGNMHKHVVACSKATAIMPAKSDKSLHLENLYSLGLDIRKYHYQAPAIIKGLRPDVLQIEPTVRKARVVNTKSKTQATQAKELNNQEMQNKIDETDLRLKHIHERIQKLQARNNDEPMPMVEMCIHPTNFATTVENFFHLSFLARQNLVTITSFDDWCAKENKTQSDSFQDNGDPLVMVVKKKVIEPGEGEEAMEVEQGEGDEEEEDNDDDDSGNDEGVQSILTLDKVTIELLAAKLNVDRPALK